MYKSVEIENILNLNSKLEKINKNSQTEIDYISEIIHAHEKVLWLCDADSDEILYISPNTKDLLNISIDDLVSDREIWIENVHPDDRHRVEISFDVRTIDYPYDIEYRTKSKDGGYIWVRDREVNILNSDGSLRYRSGIVEHITNSKNEKDTIKKEWSNFKSILDKIWVGIIVINKNFQVVYANKTCFELVNLNEDDSLEINIFDYIHDDFKEIVLRRATERMAGGNPENEYEVLLEPKYGDKIWVRMRTIRIVFNGENVILTTIHNIDEAKKASVKLAESQQNLSAILNHTPYSIFLISPNLELVDFNFAATKVVRDFTGITLKKFTKFPDYLHRKDKNFFENSFAKALKGESFVSEDEIWISSKKKIWLMNRFNPVFNDKHEITGIIYSAIDISSRKKAEIELLDNKAHLKDIVESSGGLIVYSVDKQYRLTSFNSVFKKQMLQILGVNIQIGDVFPDYFEDEEVSQISRDDFNRVFTGEEFNKESEYPDENGDIRFYDVNYYPIRSPGGEISGAGLHIWDITEEKIEREELIKSKNDLTRLNASKDKFLSMIAHDLKSPISGLEGMIGSILNGIEFLSKDEIKEYLAELHESSKNVYSLLEDLLEWSRASTGKIQFDPDNICLHMVVDSLFSLLIQNAKAKNIELVNKIDKDLYSYCDGNMISTVVRNLVSNSIKFTPSGSITCSAIEGAENIRFEVKDTGTGIEKDVIDKLFKIDESVTTMGTNNESGTGLGLIMCREFVEKNEGEIWVESEIGKGASFIFTIPKAMKFD
jgi:PAS domain S-box-containing protein